MCVCVSLRRLVVALMSAASVSGSITTGTEGRSTTTYTFEQKVPIPAYLIALVVGQLESRDISPRCRVWAEAETIEAVRCRECTS